MSKTHSTFLLFLIFILSFFLTTVFFKPQDIFSDSPIYTDDYAMHFSQCLSTKRFFASFGKCWAYDPFYLAGFPNGALANADNKAWELFYFILSPLLGSGFAFKLYVIAFFVTYPLFIYGALRNFQFSRITALIGSGLAVFFFHLSLCINFVFCGMISYVFVCFFSLYVMSLLWKLFESFNWTRYIVVTISLSILVLMHILAIVHLSIPILVAYINASRRLSFSRNSMIVVIPIIVVILNSFWLLPVVEFYDDKTTRPENYEFTFQIKNIFEPLKVYLEQKRSQDYGFPVLNNTFIEAILLLFGIAGLYFWYREGRRTLLLPFILGSSFLFCLIYYGSQSSFFALMQPQRFSLPLNLLLLVPASSALSIFIRDIVCGKKPLYLFFICALSFILLYKPVIRPFGILYKYKLCNLKTEFPQQLYRLLDCLQQQTTGSARILIEDSESTEQQNEEYYGGHFPALFPAYLRREYLCGPRPMYPVKHGYASFTRGILFEKDIESFTREDLEKYFNIYNVKWIVSWFPKSKDFFCRFPDYITKIADIDKFSVYVVNRHPSYFLKGKGTISSDYNRIDLTNVQAQDGEIIIAYHWMKKLRAVPDAIIEPVHLAGDPVGFIKIKNPPEAFALINAY